MCLAVFFFHQHYVSTLWDSPTFWVYHIPLCEGNTFYYPSAIGEDLSCSKFSTTTISCCYEHSWAYLWCTRVHPFPSMLSPKVESLGHWMGICSAYLSAAKHMFRVFVASYTSNSGTWAFQWLRLLANIWYHLFFCFILLFYFHFSHSGLCGKEYIVFIAMTLLTKNVENF